MGGAVFPLYYYLVLSYGGGDEDNGNLLQKVPFTHCARSAPSPAACHRRPAPPLEAPGHSHTSLGQDTLDLKILFVTLLITASYFIFYVACFRRLFLILANVWLSLW